MVKERSWVEINLDNYRHNLQELKQYMHPWQSFMQIVKADAYGHGALEIAKAALDEGAVMLGVANFEEGKLLRVQGIKAPILILSPCLTDEITEIISNNLIPTLSDYAFATELSQYTAEQNITVPVHVKADTGMHRSGIRAENFLKTYKKIAKLTGFSIEGILSHYASSETDDKFSAEQCAAFEQLLAKIKSLPKYIHLSNSAALLGHNCFKTNLVRLGIMSYGVYTDGEQYKAIDLRSVMTFKSTVVQVKDIKQGETVGYNQTWTAPHDGRYGIVPVGYADGYDFLLSNAGIVKINDQICKVIGKVSMDMITVDLSLIPEVTAGDEVVLMGSGANLLRAEQLTHKYQGSPYELLCQIGRRAKRYYYAKGKLVAHAPLSRREFVSSDYNDTKLSSIISSALSQRMQDDEIADLIYREVLRGFFYNKDNDVEYRKAFVHTVEFIDDMSNPDFYITKTKLSFKKILQNDYFIVACANSDEVLKRYFLRKDVEYRWLMDTNFALKSSQFKVTNVMLGKQKLKATPKVNDGCLEITCTHPTLKDNVGKEMVYTIETETLYPKTSHQLSIFITELTRGVTVNFKFPKSIGNVEAITVFSGQDKYPLLKKGKSVITVKTIDQEWVFPNSGIVFAY